MIAAVFGAEDDLDAIILGEVNQILNTHARRNSRGGVGQVLDLAN
jgi:hypothetical protein